MSNVIQTQEIHHLTLTVTDLGRAVEFYTTMLGFQKAMDLSPTRVLLANGKTILALTEAPDPSRAIPDDRFNENRVGLREHSLRISANELVVEHVEQRRISHEKATFDKSNLVSRLVFVRHRDAGRLKVEEPRLRLYVIGVLIDQRFSDWKRNARRFFRTLDDLGNPINSIHVRMVPVVRELVPDVKQYQHKTGDADRQSEHIDG